jgi:hypothetical protein
MAKDQKRGIIGWRGSWYETLRLRIKERLKCTYMKYDSPKFHRDKCFLTPNRARKNSDHQNCSTPIRIQNSEKKGEARLAFRKHEFKIELRTPASDHLYWDKTAEEAGVKFI